MDDLKNQEQYIKEKVRSEIDSVQVPHGLKEEVWKSIQPQKRRFKQLNVFPYIAMVACIFILIPLGLHLVSQSQVKAPLGTVNGSLGTIKDESKRILTPIVPSESNPPSKTDGKWVQLGARLYYTQGTVKSIGKTREGKYILHMLVEKTFPNTGGEEKPYNKGQVYTFYMKEVPKVNVINKKIIIYGGQMTSNDKDSFMGARIAYYQKNNKFVDMSGKEASLPPKDYPYQF